MKNLTIALIGFLFAAFNSKAQTTVSDPATDPVCGMAVNRSESFDYTYQGTKYYFDSFDCREAFKKNPKTFLEKKCVANKVSVDPVCGVKIDLSESYDYKYEGRVYHFHSIECKEAFKMNPKKFWKNFCAPADNELIR